MTRRRSLCNPSREAYGVMKRIGRIHYWELGQLRNGNSCPFKDASFQRI